MLSRVRCQHAQHGPAGVRRWSPVPAAEIAPSSRTTRIRRSFSIFAVVSEDAVNSPTMAAVGVPDRAVREGEVALLRIPVAVQDLPFVDEPQRPAAHQHLVQPGTDASHASGQVSFADWPNASGCFPPISGANASLYSGDQSGPQLISIGNPESRHSEMVERSTGDHVVTGPSGEAAQSRSRHNRRSSPGPAKSSALGSVTTGPSVRRFGSSLRGPSG